MRLWAAHVGSMAVVIGGGALAAVAVGLVGRPWYLRWGASHEECAKVLPGDELISQADLVATRAITVRTPREQLWPWIAQMGQGRGGLYSYDFLENLVGCDMHSADSVMPEWQDVAPGDPFRLHPEVALEVVAVEPKRALVIRGGVPVGDAAPPYDFTWAFVLEDPEPGQAPSGATTPFGATRLLVRERYGYTRRWAALLVEPVEAVSFVMSRKMLRGIKERAEGSRP
jgi:hypothetical protein